MIGDQNENNTMMKIVLTFALFVYIASAQWLPPSGGPTKKTQTGFLKCKCKGTLDEPVALATITACAAASGSSAELGNYPPTYYCAIEKMNESKFKDGCGKFRIGIDCVNINAFV